MDSSTEDQEGSMGRAVGSLTEDARRLKTVLAGNPTVFGRRRKAAFLQLCAAQGVASACATVARAAEAGEIWEASSLETLVRANMERGIGLAWLANAPDSAEAADRLLKTNAHKFVASGFETDEAVAEDIALDVNQLPATTQMGENHAPELLADWRKMSHVAHPFASLPSMPDADSRARLVARCELAAVMHRAAIDALLASWELIDAIDPPEA